MGLPKQQVREVIDVYIQAWETQDPDRVVTIFTRSATYHERVLQDPIPDREAICRARLATMTAAVIPSPSALLTSCAPAPIGIESPSVAPSAGPKVGMRVWPDG